jgi:hypothetical protein
LRYSKEVDRKNGRRRLEKKIRIALPVGPEINTLIAIMIKKTTGKNFRAMVLV